MLSIGCNKKVKEYKDSLKSDILNQYSIVSKKHDILINTSELAYYCNDPESLVKNLINMIDNLCIELERK